MSRRGQIPINNIDPNNIVNGVVEVNGVEVGRLVQYSMDTGFSRDPYESVQRRLTLEVVQTPELMERMMSGMPKRPGAYSNFSHRQAPGFDEEKESFAEKMLRVAEPQRKETNAEWLERQVEDVRP